MSNKGHEGLDYRWILTLTAFINVKKFIFLFSMFIFHCLSCSYASISVTTVDLEILH